MTNDTLNKTLAIACFIGGLAFLAVALFQAPSWVQNLFFGFLLLGISQRFAANATNGKASK